MLAKLENSTPERYGNGQQYWDDYCLGHFLRGTAQAFARYQVRLAFESKIPLLTKKQPPEASESAKKKQPGEPSDEELDQGAEKDLQAVLRHGPEVQVRLTPDSQSMLT